MAYRYPKHLRMVNGNRHPLSRAIYEVMTTVRIVTVRTADGLVDARLGTG